MNKTKIDWADRTWNPVTGCLHGCEYCYARGIAKRFGGVDIDHLDEGRWENIGGDCNGQFVVNEPLSRYIPQIGKRMTAPYPFGFEPTFHKYRLDEPQKVKKPSKIFVCSMADLFGDWVPDEWIIEVFKACEKAPQHQYLFLTKNPDRYGSLWAKGELPKKHWYGHTITTSVEPAYAKTFNPVGYNNFLSIEPLLGDASKGNWLHLYRWVIIGQQTGPGAVLPKDEWVQSIIDQCRATNVPVFVKSPLYEKFPIQEWPEGLENN